MLSADFMKTSYYGIRPGIESEIGERIGDRDEIIVGAGDGYIHFPPCLRN